MYAQLDSLADWIGDHFWIRLVALVPLALVGVSPAAAASVFLTLTPFVIAGNHAWLFHLRRTDPERYHRTVTRRLAFAGLVAAVGPYVVLSKTTTSALAGSALLVADTVAVVYLTERRPLV